MNRTLKTELQKIGIIFLAGFLIYPQLEQLFGSFMLHYGGPFLNWIFNLEPNFPTGKSFDANISMGIVGGLVVVILGYMNEIKPLRKLPFWLHCVIAAFVVTILEWFTGQIVNLGLFFGLHLQVWDYKWLPLSSSDGQINLFFSLIWLILSPVCFWLDDQLRESHTVLESGKVKRRLLTFSSMKFNIEVFKYNRFLSLSKTKKSNDKMTF